MEKSIEDSIKVGLIITATTTGIFYVLKAANVKGSIKGYGYHETCWWNSGWCPCQRLSLYKKWIKEWYNKKFYGPLNGHDTIVWEENIRLASMIFRPRTTYCTKSGWVKVIRCTYFTLIQANLVHYTRLIALRNFLKQPSNIFQSLKYHWDWCHLGGPMHLQR